jgi:hypothetical protein
MDHDERRSNRAGRISDARFLIAASTPELLERIGDTFAVEGLSRRRHTIAAYTQASAIVSRLSRRITKRSGESPTVD